MEMEMEMAMAMAMVLTFLEASSSVGFGAACFLVPKNRFMIYDEYVNVCVCV